MSALGYDLTADSVLCRYCDGRGHRCRYCAGSGVAPCEWCAKTESYRLEDGLPICRKCATCQASRGGQPCGEPLVYGTDDYLSCPACEPSRHRHAAA